MIKLMKNNSDWYFNLAARSLKLDVNIIKSYCKEHSYLPSYFYELVDKRKIVVKNNKIHVNKRNI